MCQNSFHDKSSSNLKSKKPHIFTKFSIYCFCTPCQLSAHFPEKPVDTPHTIGYNRINLKIRMGKGIAV